MTVTRLTIDESRSDAEQIIDALLDLAANMHDARGYPDANASGYGWIDRLEDIAHYVDDLDGNQTGYAYIRALWDPYR